MSLFKNPKVGDKVIFTDSREIESTQKIIKVTSKSIRITSVNSYRFNRDGTLNKSYNRNGTLRMSIHPLFDQNGITYSIKST